MIRSKSKEKSLPTLIHELDGHFSRFIRQRDTVNGRVICFTCGKKMTFQESQCGHFMHREHMPTRYDERNCHAVCEECNCYDGYHNQTYYQRMLWKYGAKEVELIEAKSLGLQKFMRHELQDLIEYYKSENRQSKSLAK